MTDYISRADAINAFWEDSDIRTAEVRATLKALPSADAVQIHEDGTLEVKVPNAQKVGRVLVMDTDSHIGGGLFYPDEAVPQSEQYKKGFEDAKRAFLVECARERRNAQLEVMLNGTVLIPQHQWIEMERELAELKSKFESADAVQGEWILVKGSNGKDYHKCSKCLHTQEITGVKNYCAVCGSRMKGGDSE